MKRIVFSLSLLLISACTPATSPQASMERANQEFAGRYVGVFFASYGAAAGSHRTEDGGTLYRWLSVEPRNVSHPASVITTPGGHFGTIGGVGNGAMVNGYCEISIRTDEDDKIQNLTLVADSIGKYSGSRCAEIFSQSQY